MNVILLARAVKVPDLHSVRLVILETSLLVCHILAFVFAPRDTTPTLQLSIVPHALVHVFIVLVLRQMIAYHAVITPTLM